jgi:hypothetical protein
VDLGSATGLRIQDKEFMLDDANLSKLIDNGKSWFTPMEMIDLINHQFFIAINCLG